jgi:hypothetical protein
MKALVGLLWPLAVLQGCATYRGTPNPDWFPRAAAAATNRTPGSVGLEVPPQVLVTVALIGPVLKVQIGWIAEQAMRTALNDGLHGGVHPSSTPPLANGSGATLVIDGVRFEHKEQTVWWLWLPPLSSIQRYEARTRLAIDLSLLDAHGIPVWIRTYDDDSGHLVWTTASADSTPLPEDIGRVVHESAWRLAQRALLDLREWIDAERMKPREL